MDRIDREVGDFGIVFGGNRFDYIIEGYKGRVGKDWKEYLGYKESAFLKFFIVDVIIRDSEFTNEDIGLFNRSFNISELDSTIRLESIRVPMDLLNLLLSDNKGYGIPKFWEHVKDRKGDYYKFKIPSDISLSDFKVRLKRLYILLDRKSDGWKVLNWKLVKV